MHPAIRTQSDGAQELYSDQAVLNCSESRDMARQEFKAESDINEILKKFGLTNPLRQVTYGEVDFDLDLQQAFAAIAAAKQAYREIPDELKAVVPSWQALLNGIESGAIQMKPETPKPEATPTVPTA